MNTSNSNIETLATPKVELVNDMPLQLLSDMVTAALGQAPYDYTWEIYLDTKESITVYIAVPEQMLYIQKCAYRDDDGKWFDTDIVDIPALDRLARTLMDRNLIYFYDTDACCTPETRLVARAKYLATQKSGGINTPDQCLERMLKGVDDICEQASKVELVSLQHYSNGTFTAEQAHAWLDENLVKVGMEPDVSLAWQHMQHLNPAVAVALIYSGDWVQLSREEVYNIITAVPA
jgi:hypothetical protein